MDPLFIFLGHALSFWIIWKFLDHTVPPVARRIRARFEKPPIIFEEVIENPVVIEKPIKKPRKPRKKLLENTILLIDVDEKPNKKAK